MAAAWRARTRTRRRALASSLAPIGSSGKATEILTRVTRDVLAPVVRSHGFAGSGGSFHRDTPDLYVSLGVERGRWNSAAEAQGSWALNIIPKREWDAGPATGRPGAVGWHIDMPGLSAAITWPARRWYWSFRPGRDPRPTVAAMILVLEEAVLPLIECEVAGGTCTCPPIVARAASHMNYKDRFWANRRVAHRR